MRFNENLENSNLIGKELTLIIISWTVIWKKLLENH